MKRETVVLAALACFSLLLAGCFKDNPAFKNKDAGPPPADGTVYWDGVYLDAPLDLTGDVFSPDLVPWPDQKAWPCTKDSECADKHDCTLDKCVNHKCNHAVKADRCLIGLQCYKAGESPKGNACQVCNPNKATDTWDVIADDSPCTSDKLSCTNDVCKKGKCTHALKPKQCLISGKCYSTGDKHPSNSCLVCNSNLSTSKFVTEADKMPCAKDGLSCTQDYCIKGKCTHPVTSGCLINKACVGEGQASAADGCKVCVPDVSKTAYTLALGAPCTQSGGKGGMCVSAGTCVGFNQKLWSAKGAYHTVLRAVDYLPDSKKVWAAGMYQETDGGTKKGVVVHATSGSVASEVSTPTGGLNDLHYRMAVGDNGAVLYHDGKKWAAATWLAKPLGTDDRLSVWGANVNKTLTFYITGRQSSASSAMTRCTLGSVIACTDHTGAANNVGLGSIFGTLTSAGKQGPLWASVQGADGLPEDIYHNPGTGTTWSTKGPKGCKDQGGSPCHLPSTTLDLEGASAADVWMVGGQGNLLQYDGKTWKRHHNVIQYQQYYTFTAVFSSAARKLTSVVGYYDSSSGKVRRIRMFNYNHVLKRWFGPITVAETPYKAPDVIWDMGGQSYTNLWLVGQRQIVGSSGKPQLAGWMLQLK